MAYTWMTKKIIYFVFSATFISFTLLGLLPSQAHAQYINSGNNVIIPSTAVISSSAYISGSTVTINGKFNNDLICAGQNVTINATVAGDVICAAQNIQVNGSVGGNLRLAGQNITLTGYTNKNASVITQSLNVSNIAVINGELAAYAQQATMDGTVNQSFYGTALDSTINGKINGNVNLQVNNLYIDKTAVIAGNLMYKGPNKANIEDPASVKGNVNYTYQQGMNEYGNYNAGPAVATGIIAMIFYWIVAGFLLGLALILLANHRVVPAVQQILKNPLPTFGWGLVAFFVIPIIFFILFLTIIGIPLGFILLFMWLIAIFVSNIITGYALGDFILKRDILNDRKASFLALLVGIVIISILFNIPFIGGIFLFISTVLGFGALLLEGRRRV